MSNKKASNNWEKHFERAVHYYTNAREEIRKIPVDDGFYAELKPLRRAAGLCWLGVAEAATGFLARRGVDVRKLCSANAFRYLLAAAKEIDGKFMKHYESSLRLVHIEVYYRGEDSVAAVKAGFDHAKFAIEKLTGTRL